LPLISANLIDLSLGTPIFPPYVIKKVKNVRIAFFGLLSPDINSAIQKTAGEKAFIKDPVETAQDIIEKLRGQADIIILLSDLGLENDRELLKKVSGIHLVLGGHEGHYLQTPIWEKNTPILQSYKRGMYIGKLQLTIENSSSFAQGKEQGEGNRFQWTLIPLDATLREDKTVSEWIRKARP
jgi:5'-nucleotidase/UDP-sugar diphosphatase